MNASDLENELRALAPARPTDRLAREIAAQLRTPAAPSLHASAAETEAAPNWLAQYFTSLGWLATAALVIAAAIFGFRPAKPLAPREPLVAEVQPTVPADSAADSTDSLRQVEVTTQLVQADEEDLILDGSEEPSRRLRFTFIEHQTWTDPETGALIEVEIPRQDVLVVPVAMQ